MNFNIVSKNNVGVVTSLLLVVLLSQSKFFNFLLDNALGRTILIMFILLISYTNKILGIVSVLFIIIMFNNSDFGYMEGLTTETQSSTTTTNEKPLEPSTTTTDEKPLGSTTPPILTDEQKKEILKNLQPNLENNSQADSSNNVNTKDNKASEGFDIIGSENTIKRGKQSNSIPVHDSVKSSDDVLPFDNSFSDSYSAF